ncbi:threonyl-tRNA synthetase [Anaerocolumna jejuensis DSM 15929]|uniref:Threonine--tRNA ligase n=1 Tax=Anaerocolumna jejuensis DSM 15929 TaxID=1121322 RepID=A0A1M6YK20_9FIRM|nr:threonine--tRNA ligase [Anaerocolumna jejuensis]SHL18470.1 threonyl-tRNA synthetase [Anaerocolumna jejuensis DSM 15929]
MKVSEKDGSIRDYASNSERGREGFCRTAGHILAQAVKRLYPEVKCAGCQTVEEGFYYDFDFEFDFTMDYLALVEKEMKKITGENLPLKRYALGQQEALELMGLRQEPYKAELIREQHSGEEVIFCQQGEYIDLWEGPQVANTGLIKALKLTLVAGAYWKGKEENKMLTRIYGTAFPKAGDLEEYLARIEEARKRDHRRLGRELGLFVLMEEGPGFPFFLPKGMVLKNLLTDYWRQIHKREGYAEISTPIMLEKSLWETSGHWEHYRENMYVSTIDEMDFVIKPMNCPGGMLVYKSQPRSYRELPIRMGELGLVHRHEKSGALHGLMRLRMFTQDDAHIFMAKEQVTDEIKGVIRLIDEVYKRFGFPYHVELSTRPEESIGSDEDWELATDGLKNALEELDMPYSINEGDGAFYGPKIDFHLVDSMGRTWQCGTIQLDFQLPARFGAEYTGIDGRKHRPIMLHRVVFGSMERFMGILIEHYGGKFPLWLSPVQVKLLPISERFLSYACSLEKELSQLGIRCEVDSRAEKIGYKIREAQLDRVPYMLILGQKEEENNSVSVRKRDSGDLGEMGREAFAEIFNTELLSAEPLKGEFYEN